MIKTITINTDTHVLVPREPSVEMQAAMEAQWEAGSYVDMAKREWSAAIAAAPQPEQAENESLRKDAELWRSYQKRKQDLLDRGLLRSPLRADELDAMAQGEKGWTQVISKKYSSRPR